MKDHLTPNTMNSHSPTRVAMWLLWVFRNKQGHCFLKNSDLIFEMMSFTAASHCIPLGLGETQKLKAHSQSSWLLVENLFMKQEILRIHILEMWLQ